MEKDVDKIVIKDSDRQKEESDEVKGKNHIIIFLTVILIFSL